MCTGKIANRWSLMIMAMTLISGVGCAGSCGCLRDGFSGRLADPMVLKENFVDSERKRSEFKLLATLEESELVSRIEHKVGVERPLQLRKGIEARGRKNGCGEFFWSSWYNDPPALADYATPDE